MRISKQTQIRINSMGKFIPSSIMICLIVTLSLLINVTHLQADTASNIDFEVDIALQRLYKSNLAARTIAEEAKAILVFPNIIKGGLILGGQYGRGALQVDGKTTTYYQTVAASYGLQIGAESFGYAMFFMTVSGLSYLQNSNGWEVGVGPSIVVMDEGAADSFSTTTFQDDILVFFFNQKGLMAGLVIQGSKITPYIPDPG